MTYKRVTLFAGHYGSGKTNIAVNYALWLKTREEHVVIADLDIVNPYFRTCDSLEDLQKAGIRLISSAYANSNVDLPAIPQEMYSVTDDRSKYAVMDIGGDDRGAFALGRFTDAIIAENNYEMLFVVNFYRPLTPDAASAAEVLAEIESACHLPFTGIVHNSNLGGETTAEDVLRFAPAAEELSALVGLPLRFTSAEKSLCNQLGEKLPNVFPLTLQKKIVG